MKRLATTKKIAELLRKEGLSEVIQDKVLTSVLDEPRFTAKFKENNLRLFVDVDGVLTNWEAAYKAAGGKLFEKAKDIDPDVTKLVEFWSEMPWMPNGRELWSMLLPLNPVLLTAAVNFGKPCREGRNLWVHKNIADDQNIIYEYSKDKYADSRSILIDDMEHNIEAFKEAGGIGILYDGNPTKAARDLYREVMELS